MTIVSPSSSFLVFTYSLAVLSVLAAIGGLLGGDATLEQITGALFVYTNGCALEGPVSCLGVEQEEHGLIISLENKGVEPLILRRSSVEECSPTQESLDIPSGAIAALVLTPCFTIAPQDSISYELYLEGRFTGKTIPVQGKILLE